MSDPLKLAFFALLCWTPWNVDALEEVMALLVMADMVADWFACGYYFVATGHLMKREVSKKLSDEYLRIHTKGPAHHETTAP